MELRLFSVEPSISFTDTDPVLSSVSIIGIFLTMIL